MGLGDQSPLMVGSGLINVIVEEKNESSSKGPSLSIHVSGVPDRVTRIALALEVKFLTDIEIWCLG